MWLQRRGLDSEIEDLAAETPELETLLSATEGDDNGNDNGNGNGAGPLIKYQLSKRAWSRLSRPLQRLPDPSALRTEDPITGRRNPRALGRYLLIPELTDLQQHMHRSTRFACYLARWGLPVSGYLPSLAKVPARQIKTAVVIGVHGYFPSRLTRALLGEPTGTSMRFANAAGDAVEAWAQKQGLTIDVSRVALEGEGRIDHRVETLYPMLLDCAEQIKAADFVFFAVHSQGSVVATHLISRLIADNIVLPGSKHCVGLLSMAGTCLGPMPGLNKTYAMRAVSKIEHDSLAELFQLQDQNSKLALEYQDALSFCLTKGVRFTLVASADDQLVPLYSALGVHVKHPGIARAVFVDEECGPAGSLSPLLRLLLLRLNVGESDFGVLKAISGPLAGSYTGKGHSKLYDAFRVYSLAVEVLTETSPAGAGLTPMFYNVNVARHLTGSAAQFSLSSSLTQCLAHSQTDKRFKPLCDELVASLPDWRPETDGLKTLKLCLKVLNQSQPKL